MSKLKVLCIDDSIQDITFLDLLYFSTHSDKIELITCGSLQEGDALATENEIDVCLLDLHLPDSEGIEGVKKFIEDHPTVPVVVITGQRESQGISEALQSGVHDYLVKGEFTQRALHRVIEHAVERGGFRKKLIEAENQLKKANAELTAMNEKVVAASSAKSQFLSGMSHEIRTPLNTIIGIGDLLRETQLDLTQKSFVDVLFRSGTHLLELVNQVLDLSKIEAGELTLQDQPWDAPELLNEIRSWMDVTTQLKNLNCSFHMDENFPKGVMGDSQRVRQVLLNLLGNAIKFTEKGEIRLEAKVKDDVKSAPGITHVSLTVTDTGIGIAPDKMDSIFDEFSQGDQSITRRFGGTGLGLTISKKVVEKMGGTIRVTSQQGVGSKFEVQLPLRNTQIHTVLETAIQSLKTDSRSNAKRRRVLVVEDVSDNRFLFNAYFKGLPFEADYVENGRLAVAKVKSEIYDIILMDLQMPVMDGFTATREIRNWEHTIGLQPVPIVALTAHAFSEEIEKAKRSGCDACLSKPIRRNNLIFEMTRYLQTKNKPTTAEADKETL